MNAEPKQKKIGVMVRKEFCAKESLELAWLATTRNKFKRVAGAKISPRSSENFKISHATLLRIRSQGVLLNWVCLLPFGNNLIHHCIQTSKVRFDRKDEEPKLKQRYGTPSTRPLECCSCKRKARAVSVSSRSLLGIVAGSLSNVPLGFESGNCVRAD